MEKPTLKWYVEPGCEVCIPSRGTEGSAGYDLRSSEGVAVQPGKIVKFSLGVRVAIPMGYVGLLELRSSIRSEGLTQLGVGIIDSDYRGVLMAMAMNTSDDYLGCLKGGRIAQLVIVPCLTSPVSLVSTLEELGSTARGEGGFGSTGRS